MFNKAEFIANWNLLEEFCESQCYGKDYIENIEPSINGIDYNIITPSNCGCCPDERDYSSTSWEAFGEWLEEEEDNE